jgi:hypothetical protein
VWCGVSWRAGEFMRDAYRLKQCAVPQQKSR